MEAQNEQHWFSVEITVTGVDPKNTDTIRREYRSVDAASAHKAAGELWGAIKPETLSRMHPVSDGR